MYLGNLEFNYFNYEEENLQFGYANANGCNLISNRQLASAVLM